jgi:hypothetical protein
MSVEAAAEAGKSPVAVALAWLRFHAALRTTWKQGAQPCVSTGQSIHAVLTIAHHQERNRQRAEICASGPAQRLSERRQPHDHVAVRLRAGRVAMANANANATSAAPERPVEVFDRLTSFAPRAPPSAGRSPS